MAIQKITKRTVDALGAAERDQLIWDGELKGFGLKVTRAGAKSYLVQYRMGGRGTPTRRVTIGAHGSPWTPTTARTEAERLLLMAKRGTDPRHAERERQHQAVELAFTKYVDGYLSQYGARAWRPRTLANVELNLRRYAVPVLRDKPLSDITRADIGAILSHLPPASPALPRNVFTHIRKLFAWAVERGDIDRSPFEGMKGPAAVASRDRVLGDTEVATVWGATFALGLPFGPMFRLLLITAQRRDEVAGLNWNEVDRKERCWRIPAARCKNNESHIVPLSGLAIAELDGLAGGEDWPCRGLIFTKTGERPSSGYSRAKRRIDREMLRIQQVDAIARGRDPEAENVKPWRLHDLRRTAATNFQRLGVRFEVTEAVLNHVSGSRSGVAGIYQRHDWAAEKAEALQSWADRLAAVVEAN